MRPRPLLFLGRPRVVLDGSNVMMRRYLWTKSLFPSAKGWGITSACGDGKPGDTPSASEICCLERALAPWGGRQSVNTGCGDTYGINGVRPKGAPGGIFSQCFRPKTDGWHSHRVRTWRRWSCGFDDNITAERYNGALGGILPMLLRKPRD